MRKLYIYTLVVVAVTTIVITTLVFAFPDTSGELRTDLAVGDFYELTGDQHVTTYTITEIDGDDYTVHVVQQGKGSRDYTEVMSKDKFLSQVYLRSRENVPNSADSRMTGSATSAVHAASFKCNDVSYAIRAGYAALWISYWYGFGE